MNTSFTSLSSVGLTEVGEAKTMTGVEFDVQVQTNQGHRHTHTRMKCRIGTTQRQTQVYGSKEYNLMSLKLGE